MNRRIFLTSTTTAILTSAVSVANAQQKATSVESRSMPFSNLGKRIPQAPYGGDVTNAINNYNRVSPYIANAGLLHKGGLQEAQALGFKLIIDLRGHDEKGVEEEEKLAQSIGIKYKRVPVTSRAPGWDQVNEFASLVHDSKNYPILVHCVSSNRSGAIWALYRASVGVSPLTAIEEGRAAGLASREAAVRKALKIQ